MIQTQWCDKSSYFDGKVRGHGRSDQAGGGLEQLQFEAAEDCAPTDVTDANIAAPMPAMNDRRVCWFMETGSLKVSIAVSAENLGSTTISVLSRSIQYF